MGPLGMISPGRTGKQTGDVMFLTINKREYGLIFFEELMKN